MANERRLIYADSGKVVLEYMKKHIVADGSDYLQGYLAGIEGLANGLAELPTVDAVEVVRCKDCKHCIYISYACGDVRCGKLHSDYIKEDGFCNYGERIDNERKAD